MAETRLLGVHWVAPGYLHAVMRGGGAYKGLYIRVGISTTWLEIGPAANIQHARLATVGSLHVQAVEGLFGCVLVADRNRPDNGAGVQGCS